MAYTVSPNDLPPKLPIETHAAAANRAIAGRAASGHLQLSGYLFRLRAADDFHAELKLACCDLNVSAESHTFKDKFRSSTESEIGTEPTSRVRRAMSDIGVRPDIA